jgi:hypothetical protein
MSSRTRLHISGDGQIFKSDEFLCNVKFSFLQIGNFVGDFIRSDGKLLIEESKRELPEVLKAIRNIPVELRIENREKIIIIVFKLDEDLFDGKFEWMVWD